MIDKVELLNKGLWSLSDIANYYGVSKNHANQIKLRVEIDFGIEPIEAGKKQTRVRAENVNKHMGGISRLNELAIIKMTNEIKGAKGK